MAGRFSVEGMLTLTDRLTKPFATIEGKMSRITRRISAQVGRLDKQFGNVHNSIVKVGKVVGVAGLAAAGGLAVLTGASRSVDDELQKLGTVITPVLGGIDDALERSKLAALEWSKQHKQSAEEFIQANYNMASAGLDETQALAGTKAAMRLATATMGDATTAGNLLSTVYNNMGDKSADASEEMARLGDILATTQAKFQIADLGQLNEGLKYGIPAAQQYGVSIAELSTVVGALNTAGLQGSQAGTAFNATMSKMTEASQKLGFQVAKTADGGTDFIGTIKNIEDKFGTFADMTDKQKLAFQKAFGQEGLRALSLMMGKSEELAGALDAVANSTGNAAKAQERIESSKTNQLAIMANKARASIVKLGDAFLPLLVQLTPAVEAVAGAVESWVDKNAELIGGGLKDFIKTVGDNLDTITRALEAIGIGLGIFYTYGAAVKVASAVTAVFNAVLAANPLTLWLVVIAAVAAALYYFWPQISEGAKAAWDATVSVTMKAWEGLKSFFVGVAEFVVGVLSFTPLGAVMIRLVKAIVANWDEIKSGALAVWDSVVSAAGVAATKIQGVMQPIGEFFSGLWQGIADTFTSILGWVFEKISRIIDVARAVGRKAFGGDREGEGDSAGASGVTPAPQVLGPHERAAGTFSREVKESLSTERSEVVIHDKTGRAEVVSKPGQGKNLSLQRSGGF